MRFQHINLLHTHNSQQETFVRKLTTLMGKEYVQCQDIADDIEAYCDDYDIDMLIFSCRNEKKTIQQLLDKCRGLRLPYMFLTDTMSVSRISKILLPVTMLEEEVHKSQIAAHVARYNKAKITILQANDYGSKAEQNVHKIETVFKQFQLQYQVIKAAKDSFNLYKETTDRQSEWKADLLILTASRDYGLDDILFGPPERKVIRQSQIPVMLVNPRGDLYALCD